MYCIVLDPGPSMPSKADPLAPLARHSGLSTTTFAVHAAAQPANGYDFASHLQRTP